jgi:hypothetical protein
MPPSVLLTVAGVALLVGAMLLNVLVLGAGGLASVLVVFVMGLLGVVLTLIGAIAVGVRLGMEEARDR